MLEIKDATLIVNGKTLFNDLSFVALDQQVTCVYGGRGCGKTSLLEAFLGLRPVDSGYLTVDGELIDTLSASFFRSQMAYVPQTFPFGTQRVSDLFEMLVGLKNDSTEYTQQQLLSQWRLLAIDKGHYDAVFNELPNDVQQRTLLSFAGVLTRQMILLDEPTRYQLPETWTMTVDYIKRLAEQGRVVLLTTSDENLSIQANRLISFHLQE